ncbi:unnamed protein product, partial [Nesidiocoris tenuis]
TSRSIDLYTTLITKSRDERKEIRIFRLRQSHAEQSDALLRSARCSTPGTGKTRGTTKLTIK